MTTPRRKPHARARRPGSDQRESADQKDVLQALMQRDGITTLLKSKRISLATAQDALTSVKAFVGDVTDDDERVKPLIEHMRRLAAAPDDRAKTMPKRVGQTARYKAQTNKQRRTMFLNVPLSPSFEINGRTIQDVYVKFEEERIIITRAK